MTLPNLPIADEVTDFDILTEEQVRLVLQKLVHSMSCVVVMEDGEPLVVKYPDGLKVSADKTCLVTR